MTVFVRAIFEAVWSRVTSFAVLTHGVISIPIEKSNRRPDNEISIELES
jgi:hypothetical protein